MTSAVDLSLPHMLLEQCDRFFFELNKKIQNADNSEIRILCLGIAFSGLYCSCTRGRFIHFGSNFLYESLSLPSSFPI